MDLLIYHYDDYHLNESILSLYKSVFNVDFSEKFQWWYLDNPNGKSIGVIAVDNDEVVGHWAVSPLEFRVEGERTKGLISLAAMIHSRMQGQGLFKRLSNKLLDYLKELKRFSFIVGFPNDNSLFVHLNRMDYKLVGNYHFRILPQNRLDSYTYTKIDKPGVFISDSKYSLLRNSEYLLWRYPTAQYEYWQSDKNDNFIITRFNNTVDIILQSSTTEALEAFSAYLYEKEKLSAIKLWTDDKKYELYNDREYHFCIHMLDEKYNSREIIEKVNWNFQMGDADLF